MFERFTERAKATLMHAQKESQRLQHGYIGTEHILIGLLREKEGLACQVLEDHDVTEELSDVLTAISVISKRLARKLTLLSEEEKTRGGKTDE